jgi:8-oxo-dGTP diphosphatase
LNCTRQVGPVDSIVIAIRPSLSLRAKRGNIWCLDRRVALLLAMTVRYYEAMAHIHDLIDFTVSAHIVHPDLDKVLLIHHKKQGFWLQPGGHVELDEDTDQALLREIKEETGLDVTPLTPQDEAPEQEDTKTLRAPNFMQIHRIHTEPDHRHIDLKYVCLANSEAITLAEAEHHAIRWFSKADLEDPKNDIRPEVAYYSLKAIELAKLAAQ